MDLTFRCAPAFELLTAVGLILKLGAPTEAWDAAVKLEMDSFRNFYSFAANSVFSAESRNQRHQRLSTALKERTRMRYTYPGDTAQVGELIAYCVWWLVREAEMGCVEGELFHLATMEFCIACQQRRESRGKFCAHCGGKGFYGRLDADKSIVLS